MPRSWGLIVERRSGTILLVFVVLLVALAWANRFAQDDAFISFRYARNLVAGHGLVFNPGEPVEGYTNFLWTLLIAGGMAVGIEPVACSFALGLMCFVFTLLATYQLAGRLFSRAGPRLLVVVLLGTNYTFSAYATGGLETQLQACLLTAVAWLALRLFEEPSSRSGTAPIARATAFGLLSAAALLTRLDSAVMLLVWYPVVLFGILRHGTVGYEKSRARPWIQVAIVLGLPTVIVGAWLLWKLNYYGDLLPNTFYAKIGAPGAWRRGLGYLAGFAATYWLAPVLLTALILVPRIVRRCPPAVAMLAFTAVLWCSYVVKVGGDFMEFRFMVPLLPIGFVLATWLIIDVVRRPVVQVILVATLLLGSVYHAWTYDTGRTVFGCAVPLRTESFRTLQGHLSDPDENWQRVGEVLGELFAGPDGDVVIATTAAGAIPYYSGLKTVDMLGLNDRHVARHGTVLGSRPGHQKMATFEYMTERGVHLVVGHPAIGPRDPAALPQSSIGHDYGRFADPAAHSQPVPEGATLLGIPLDVDHQVFVLYLVRSDWVDEVIRRRGLRQMTFDEVFGGR